MDGGLLLGSVRQDDSNPRRCAPGSFAAHVVVDDITAIYQRCFDAAVVVVRGPETTDCGSDEIIVLDPEGDHWSFGTSRGAEPG